MWCVCVGLRVIYQITTPEACDITLRGGAHDDDGAPHSSTRRSHCGLLFLKGPPNELQECARRRVVCALEHQLQPLHKSNKLRPACQRENIKKARARGIFIQVCGGLRHTHTHTLRARDVIIKVPRSREAAQECATFFGHRNTARTLSAENDMMHYGASVCLCVCVCVCAVCLSKERTSARALRSSNEYVTKYPIQRPRTRVAAAAATTRRVCEAHEPCGDQIF